MNGCRIRSLRFNFIRILTYDLIDNRSESNIFHTSDHKKMENKKTVNIVFHRAKGRVFVSPLWRNLLRTFFIYRVVDQVWVTTEIKACTFSFLRSGGRDEIGEFKIIYLPHMTEDRTNNVTNSSTEMNWYYFSEYTGWQYEEYRFEEHDGFVVFFRSHTYVLSNSRTPRIGMSILFTLH